MGTITLKDEFGELNIQILDNNLKRISIKPQSEFSSRFWNSYEISNGLN